MRIPMDSRILHDLSNHYDSFYLYDEKTILQRIQALREAFPEVEFLYSVKSNPHPEVLKTMLSHGFGTDAASLGEVLAASRCYEAIGGHEMPDRDRIFYSAPGKSRKDLLGAWQCAAIIADSPVEIRRIEEIAAEMDKKISIGVRINPAYTIGGTAGTGAPAKFGIDEEQFFSILESSGHPHLRINGIHVHLRSQMLNTALLINYHNYLFDMADRIEAAIGAPLDYINLGSGIGIPFTEQDREVDLSVLSGALKEHLRRRKENGKADTRIMIESGRYAPGKSGWYVTKVMDRKISRGKTFIVLNSTMNGFVRPSLVEMVRHLTDDPAPAAWEPFFTGLDTFQFLALRSGDEEVIPAGASEDGETVDLVGSLCTGVDVIASDIRMPHLEPGDLVIITNAGAYAAVMSPMQFASMEKPAQIFLAEDGTIRS